MLKAGREMDESGRLQDAHAHARQCHIQRVGPPNITPPTRQNDRESDYANSISECCQLLVPMSPGDDDLAEVCADRVANDYWHDVRAAQRDTRAADYLEVYRNGI